MLPRPVLAISRFLLILEGQSVILHAVEGETGTGEPLSTLTGEPVTIVIDLAMGKPLAEWTTAMLNGSALAKSGAIVTTIDNKAQSYRYFRNAVIDAVTLPAMDVSISHPAWVTIVFKPAELTDVRGDNAILTATAITQKTSQCSNFRLRIGDLPCSRISKIASWTITRRALTDAGAIAFPSLNVTFSAVDVQPWQQWCRDFAPGGDSAARNELEGRLEFLDTSRTEVLGTVTLSQIGCVSLSRETAVAAEAVTSYVAELSVKKMIVEMIPR